MTRSIAEVGIAPPPDLLLLTRDLVAIRSESYEEGPFVDWIQARLSEYGHLSVTRLGDNLVARTTLGRDQRVVLAGHTDTVPANNNEIPRIDGDTVWGLGATDMKGGLAVMLALAQTATNPAVDLTFVFYAREEVARADSGLGELADQVPHLLEGDCAVLGEPTGAVLEAGCQGAIRVEVKMAGARAHTARPWMGRNAIHRLGPVLDILAQWGGRQPVIDQCEYRESLQAVAVEGGVAGNVVPDNVGLKIHYRFAPDRDVSEAEDFVRDLLGDHMEPSDTFDVIDAASSCPPDLTHPLIDRLIRQSSLDIRAKLGWTDVARFAEMGIPAVNFGPGDPPLAHTVDEHVHRDELYRCYNGIAMMIGYTHD